MDGTLIWFLGRLAKTRTRCDVIGTRDPEFPGVLGDGRGIRGLRQTHEQTIQISGRTTVGGMSKKIPENAKPNFFHSPLRFLRLQPYHTS